jgi:two-component system OmpR family sensor kinase
LFERGARQHPDDLERVMTGIRAETARMGHLVEDLLLLARMDEQLEIQRAPVELVSLAAEAVEAAGAVGPLWPMRLEAEGPVEVLGDRARLRQVFDNLLSNVRAHTPVGTSTVVRISERDQAVIEVIDDGPGIAADHAERLFERFFRADPSRSRDTGGAGLGLSIVAAIVAAHGGTVEAAPAPGRGSVFIVRIPLSQPQG